MGLIAYPPVFDAKRIRPLRKSFFEAKRKRIKPVYRPTVDIDQLNAKGLNIFRERCMPQTIREIVKTAAAELNIPVLVIAEKSRKRKAVYARNAVIYAIKQARPMLSAAQIAKWFARDHTTVLHGLASHADRMGLPNLVGYDIARVRCRNARISAEIRSAILPREKVKA